MEKWKLLSIIRFESISDRRSVDADKTKNKYDRPIKCLKTEIAKF